MQNYDRRARIPIISIYLNLRFCFFVNDFEMVEKI